MSSPHPQTRSSINLGPDTRSDNPSFNNRLPRHPPPRLQHSPSLPNIRFPPYSDEDTYSSKARETLQPLTPPSVISGLLSTTKNLETSSKTLEHRESLSLDDLSICRRQTQSLKNRRRRVDRDSGHPLLTPPLTPSSSLRTTTSVDSAGHNDRNETKTKSRVQDVDEHSTRFLLLSNISKQISGDTLRASIVDSLTSACLDPPDDSKDSSPPSHNRNLSDKSIKGVFLRQQQVTGTVMLAFWDVRDAEMARTIISTPSTGPLVNCVGDEMAEDGTKAWIACQFLTRQELIEITGDSIFLASTDATFYLIVEDNGSQGRDHEEDLRVVDDRSVQNDSDSDENTIDVNVEDALNDYGIKLPIIHTFLRSFGDIRSISLVDDLQQQSKKTLHVEYHDVRVAKTAYENTNGRVLFGMKLTVFGRDILPHLTNSKVSQTNDGHHQFTSPTLPIFPFPAPSAISANEPGSNLGPPGQYSQIRERFLYVEDPESRPRRVSAGETTYANSVSRSSVPSPKYFYESNPAERDMSSTGIHGSNASLCAAVGGSLAPAVIEERADIEGGLDVNYGDMVSTSPLWPSEALQIHHPGFYGAHTDCYYCPSRRTPSQTPGGCYATTQSPFYHHVDQRPQAPHSIPFPSFTPPSQRPVYEHDIHPPQPLQSNLTAANVGNWPFEQGIMLAPHAPGGDRWVYDAQAMVCSGIPVVPYCPPQMQMAAAPNAPYLVPSNMHEAPTQNSHSHRLRTPTGRLHLRNRGAALQGASLRESSLPPERNQLNLARIEDGQDTRTTVMIKNIPNKMSDKDLIAYIGKVCPRRIDFLYLRMDFQNGCNVGYAFVNFITVQDLLLFARKKLGEKWNMFSSEKVLQMSYANYQGKEALVEKFKNSCIMDEREAWRPKIFYSEPGPEQGLPEPFPAPTHLRRKERGSFNRGALYVPGVSRGTVAPAQPQHVRRQHLQDERVRYSEH